MAWWNRWWKTGIGTPNATPIDEVAFVVVDLEMSGLNVKRDKILSIGAVVVKNNTIALSNAFYVEIRQHDFENKAVGIHELVPDSGISEADAIRQFAAFCGDRPLVGHFVSLDKCFLKHAFSRQGKSLSNRFIDTVNLLPKIDDAYRKEEHPTPTQWSLEAVSTQLGFPTDYMHDALGDAFATAVLFAHIISALKERGLRKLGDL